MEDFVEAARLDQIPTGTSTVVTIEGKDIALFNVEGSIYAVDDQCVHLGSSPVIGKLDGKLVIYRSQGWRYDIMTRYANSELEVAAYPVKVVDGRILIAI